MKLTFHLDECFYRPKQRGDLSMNILHDFLFAKPHNERHGAKFGLRSYNGFTALNRGRKSLFGGWIYGR